MDCEVGGWRDDQVEEGVPPARRRALYLVIRCILLIALLYFFICSLNLLSCAFTLIGGTSGHIHHFTYYTINQINSYNLPEISKNSHHHKYYIKYTFGVYRFCLHTKVNSCVIHYTPPI